MARTVPTLLARALAERSITARALAARLGYSGNSFVSNVLTGKKPLPLERAEDWAEAAGMRDREREEFLLACCLELTPPLVQRLLRDLLRRAGPAR